MAKNDFSFASFSYRHFNWLGKAVGKLFYSNRFFAFEGTLDDAGIKIYPEAYYSMIGFTFLFSIAITLPLAVISGMLFILPLPLLVIALGYAVPKIVAKDRAQKLDLEVPFSGAYVSVMATGGLSPYDSLRRLKNCDLLPNFSRVVKDIEVDVQIKGADPVSAIEKSAKNLPSKEYRDLMLGYTSALRTGGDVVHYLFVRTETMFKDLSVKIKAFGERTSVLMESYITVSILMTLTLAVMYMTSLSLQQFWNGSLSADTFLFYGFIMVPIISVFFIYLSDVQQMSPPIHDWRAYKAFLFTLPITAFLILVMFLPFAANLTLPFAAPFENFVIWLRTAMGLPAGYEAAIGLSVALLISAVPGVIAHHRYSESQKGIERNITAFMRDLTEARKTGISPEKCVENFAGRNYGKFSSVLETAARQIKWGMSFGVIYETFKKKIKSWTALMNMYLLVDAIQVGGGSPETLETLTRFSEELSTLEKEKKSTLRPLLLMPYIGAGILLFSIIAFLTFNGNIVSAMGHQSIPFVQVATIILPPLIVQVFCIGLVTGKMCSGQTSSGFIHAFVLILVALLVILVASKLTMPFQTGGGF
jgi:flagellar protein FlaJ